MNDESVYKRQTNYSKVQQSKGSSAQNSGTALSMGAIADDYIPLGKQLERLPEKIKTILIDWFPISLLGVRDRRLLGKILDKLCSLKREEVDEFYRIYLISKKDLNWIDISLEKYSQQLVMKNYSCEHAIGAKLELLGLEDVYKDYRLYQQLSRSQGIPAALGGSSIGSSIVYGIEINNIYSKLEDSLAKKGISGGVIEFEKLILNYKEAFRERANFLSSMILTEYQASLLREREKDTTMPRSLKN